MIVRTSTAMLGASAVAMSLGVGAVFAHIPASPIAIEAGKPATIAFDVEHGCAGSNTVELDIKMPDGITDGAPVAKPGWTTNSVSGIISFAGGNLDAKTPDTFSITFTAPATAGEINFPIVQKCAVGESDWITPQLDGQPEPDFPAAQVKVTAGPPTSADLVVVPDDDDDATGTVVATSASASKSDSSSNAPVIIAVVAAVIVIGGGATYLVLRKKKTAPPAKPNPAG
ncbi:MAG TPA: DUF1775 domain-containing protein [Ilumatobacteraceae bacterium]